MSQTDLRQFIIPRYNPQFKHELGPGDDGFIVNLTPQALSEPIHLFRQVLGANSYIYCPPESEAYLSAHGMFNTDGESSARQVLMADGVTWIGAEVESVDAVIKNGKRARLTNINVKYPYSVQSMLELEMSLSLVTWIDDPSDYAFACRTVRSNDTIKLYPYAHRAYEYDFERKLLSFELPLLIRNPNATAYIIGGSHSYAWEQQPLARSRRIIIVDSQPAAPVLRPNQILQDVSDDNMHVLLKDVRKGDFVHVNIQGPKEADSAHHTAAYALSQLTNRVAVFCRSRGAQVLMRLMPLFDRKYMCVPHGRILVQPFDRKNSFETRLLLSKKTEDMRVDVHQLVEQLTLYNSIRSRFRSDSFIESTLKWLAINHVQKSDMFSNPAASVGFLSISNSSNSIHDVISFAKQGGVFTMPFASLGSPATVSKDVLTTIYYDHVITCGNQWRFPFVYPLNDVSAIGGRPSVDVRTMSTVLVTPHLLSVEQSSSNYTGRHVKYVSAMIRKMLPSSEFNMPYKIRDTVPHTECPWYHMTAVVGGEFRIHIDDHPLAYEFYVSGHLMYYMIGEMLGLPIGMRRLFREKRWNVRGVRSAEKDTMNRMIWHYDVEDWAATYAAQHLMMKLHVPLVPDMSNEIFHYCEMVRREITDLRDLEPGYRASATQSQGAGEGTL